MKLSLAIARCEDIVDGFQQGQGRTALNISTPQRPRKGASTAEGPDLQTARQARIVKGRRHSADLLGDGKATPQNYDIHRGLIAIHSGVQPNEDSDQPKSKFTISPFQKRKIAVSHSQFVLTSTSSTVSTDKVSQGDQGEGHEEATPSLYTIFQLCIKKIPKVKLHPDALLKIVSFLSLLIHKWSVLKICDKETMISDDVTQLFEILWKNLDTDSSNVARTCVGVLLDCAEFLASCELQRPSLKNISSSGLSVPMNLSDSEDEEETPDDSPRVQENRVEDELLWTTVVHDLSSVKWSVRFKAVETFTTVVQFVRQSDDVDFDYRTFHPNVQSSLAHGFCLLVQLLMDQNSNVCARVKYLISGIKESSLEAMKFFLKNFFYEQPAYREEVLSTFSLLDSSLPELQFLNVDILTNLLRITTVPHGPLSVPGGKSTGNEQDGQASSLLVEKKVSDSSLLSGQGGSRAPSPKVSVNSTTLVILADDPEMVKVAERIISLLLRHLANPRIDVAESMKKCQSQRSGKNRGTISNRRPGQSSTEEILLQTLRTTIFCDLHCLPQDLRKSPLFEVFLNHIFPVLDQNVQFGKTKGFLSFVLKVLCFCAAPNQTDYIQMKLEDRLQSRDAHSQLKGCSYSLSSLPPHLQAPWLRVYFVILYKYIHDYSEVEPRSQHQGIDMLILTQWCLHITLNTLDEEPHECKLISLTDIQSKRPSLHRQFTIDTFANSVLESLQGEIPKVTIDDGANEDPAERKLYKPLIPFPEEPEPRDPITTASTESVPEEDEVKSKPGLCVSCGKPSNEYAEDVIAIALVAVGTCCHRFPHTVSGYLVSKIIPAIARVVVSGSHSSQSSSEPPPGSAMSVAKHIFASILTQFGDRRLFLFMFGNDYGKKSKTVFTALVLSLNAIETDATAEQNGDGESDGGLSQHTIIKYFLDDATSSTKDIQLHSVINLATFVDIVEQYLIDRPSPVQLTKDLILWDSFCKKLKGNTAVLRDKTALHALLRVIIVLFQNSLNNPSPYSLGSYHAHTIQSLSQSLSTIIEFALYNVYCPLSGLVELAALWYRLFQQHSHREAEKLVKIYINELRLSLKARIESDRCPRQDNFLSLIQVLLLEEAGYLGYVDSLSTKKSFTPDLKRDYETHCLPVIDSLQWDFTDALSYICARNLPGATEVIAQLKLSLSQLVALRIQHSRVPVKSLSRLVSGDPRAILTVPTSFRAVASSVQPRWQDYMSAIQLLAWLLLGALCYNAVDAVAIEMKIEGSISGQCKLLESLNPKLDKVTRGVIKLVVGVLQRIAISPNNGFGFISTTFVFASVWTVYMELYVKNSTALIVEFWQKIIGRLTYLLSSEAIEETYRVEVIRNLNELVVARIKTINLSCYALLIPVWRELLTTVVDTNLKIPDISTPLGSADMWYRDCIQELVAIEEEWHAENQV